MENENTNLGQYLKEIRITKNLSLREVEKLTKNKVSNAYLSQLETGAIVKPSPHILESLAEAYKISYNELMVAAGYIRLANSKKSGVAFFNKEDITEDERKILLEYLEFYRKTKAKKENEER